MKECDSNGDVLGRLLSSIENPDKIAYWHVLSENMSEDGWGGGRNDLGIFYGIFREVATKVSKNPKFYNYGSGGTVTEAKVFNAPPTSWIDATKETPNEDGMYLIIMVNNDRKYPPQ